jgi:hypothetical protein
MSAAAFPEGPLFPRLGASALQPGELWFVVAPRVGEPAAGKIARREIFARWLAPADIRSGQATALDRIRPIRVPFWRIEVAVDGFHVSLFDGNPAGRGALRIPLPMMSPRHRTGALMVSARSAFASPVGVPRSLSNVGFSAPALEVAAPDLVPDSAAAGIEGGDWEALECDVPRDVAEAVARQAALRAVQPRQALYSKYEARVLGVSLVRYPIYYLRYRYDGEAREHGPEDCAVAVSAHSGKLVASKHPSSRRAVAGKLKRLVSFG